jgi:TIR domain
MARIEKTVFISYRRADESWGLAIFQDLTQNGYDVFIDYDGIASGNFETVILENIGARAHFLVLLTPTALDRCSDPTDWMRREIEAALDSRRNIVPLMLEGFDFGTPAIVRQLTGKLAELKKYNGLEIPKARFFSSEMERLRSKFLNVRVDAVLHPASDSAQRVAKEQQDKATIHCGYPLANSQQADLEAVLCRGVWLAQSAGLVDAMLVAIFSPDHSFRGQTRPDPNRVRGVQLVAPADFQGRWQMVGPQLFLEFPMTTLSGTSPVQVTIQITRISEGAFSGIDGFGRAWGWAAAAGKLA